MTKPLTIAYVKACWHAEIVNQTEAGFRAEMDAQKADCTIDVIEVPGALEMPMVAKKLAKTGKYDGVVCAALVVNGGIYRHEFVAQAVVSGIVDASLVTDVPIYSVSLTPHEFQETPEHMEFYKKHFVKKGAEAARAVLKMAELAI